jgi:hypothetical protein
VSRTFCHAALETQVAGQVSTHAKKSARYPLSGELTARSHGNRKKIYRVADRDSGALQFISLAHRSDSTGNWREAWKIFQDPLREGRS